MVKRNAIVAAICAILLAMGIACDSSSSSGGGGTVTTAASYTQTDLTGVWALRGFLARKTLKFDDQGQLSYLINSGVKFSPFIGEITVAADGRLSGKAAVKRSPTWSEVLVFNDMRFTAKGEIIGTLVYYTYFVGTGKTNMQASNVRMTRYDR